MKKSEYLNSIASTIDARNAQLSEQQSKLSIDQFDSEKDFKRALNSFKSRIKENETIKAQLVFNDIADLLYTHKVDIQALLNEANKNTRECKNRFVKTLNAIASRDCEKLKSDDFKLYSAIFSNRAKTNDLELRKIQSIMNHATTTQARYFADFAQYLKIATRHKANDQQMITFDTNSAFFKKIAALFA